MLLILGLGAYVIYQVKFYNLEVAQELREQPNGDRAKRVMLMTVDDRETIPVNYLREADRVFIGADSPWWREMRGEGQPVAILIMGEIFSGQARAITDRPNYTRDVFKRLRPNVPEWLPNQLRGVLVEIELAGSDGAGSGGAGSNSDAEALAAPEQPIEPTVLEPTALPTDEDVEPAEVIFEEAS